MASAVAAVKEACLLAAVCVVLLHSSMGQQPLAPEFASPYYYGQQPPPSPPPASPDCPYTGQQQPPPPSPPPVVPAPPPTPTPTPAPAPAPAPAPTINCSYSDCGSQCTTSCQASYNATARNCTAMAVGAFEGCYGSCTNNTNNCPGKSCVHSVCDSSCSCDNPHASSCCQYCRTAVAPALGLGSAYQQCQSYNERYMGYCMMGCVDSCYKNCTQGA